MPQQIPTQVEQAIIDELLSRQWVSKQQLNATREAIEAKRLRGPIHHALFEQRLIKHAQKEVLEEFLHKDLIIGRFRVSRKLGSGAMGDVFLGADDAGERVAIKIISKRFADDPNFIKRFDREIESITRLEHPAIARAIDYGRHEGLPFLAMEYVEGPSLSQLLDKHGPLPSTYALQVIKDIAEGLGYVFQKTQLVHRDIKPENILVVPEQEIDKRQDSLYTRHDRAVLIDFGLARSFTDNERLTMTGVTMGTPHYMSPEQIRGSQNLDARSDIYALGATLYHLLTGKTPYSGTSPGAVMTAHLTEAVPDPQQLVPSLPIEVRDLVMMAMAKDPDARYHSLEALATACGNLIENITPPGGDMQLLRKPLVFNRPQGQKQTKTAKEAPRSASPSLRPPPQPGSTEPAPAANTPSRGIADIADADVSLPSLVEVLTEEDADNDEHNGGGPQTNIRDRIKQKARGLSSARRPVTGCTEDGPVPRLELPSKAAAAADAEAAARAEPRFHVAPPAPASAIDDAFDLPEERNPGYSGTEALRQLQSDRVRTRGRRAKAQPNKRGAGRPPRAAEGRGLPAIGIMPLTILGISLVILLSLIVYTMLLS